MLSQADIDAFQEANAPALEAAAKYVKGAEKGLPSDRWADGTAGAKLVAQGIKAQMQIMAMLTETIAAMSAQAMEQGRESMGLGNGKD